MSHFIFSPEARPVPALAISATPENNIIFNAGPAEMLRVTEDGFYVRGQKVPVDNNEGLAVYRAFRNFLAYHALTRPWQMVTFSV